MVFPVKLFRSALVTAILFAPLGFAQSSFGVRILLGAGDQQNTRWDGSISSSDATVARLEPWRFEAADSISGSTWKMSTHPIKLFLGGIFLANASKAKSLVIANGVIVQLSDVREGAQVSITTAEGNFSFRPSDIVYGSAKSFLNGRAQVERVPPATQITKSPDEQDYPASAVDHDGAVWVAYVEFRHSQDHDRLRANMTAPPNNFEQYRTRTGGDQILVRRFAGGVWSEPIEITPAGLDLYRPSIAIDGKNRLWVFWSQNEKSNFDVHARVIEGRRDLCLTSKRQFVQRSGEDFNFQRE